MRVLYFSHALSVHDRRFLQANVDDGQQVFFLRLDSGEASLEKDMLPTGVEEIAWPHGGESFSWWRARQFVASFRELLAIVQPDILHAGPLHSVSVLAAASGFRPLVQMSWGSDILWEAQQNWWKRKMVKFSLSRADALIVDCEAVSKAAAKMGMDADRIVRFPWGIDLELFSATNKKSSLRKKLGWVDKFVLIQLRTWEVIYGAEIVAKAFVKAARQEADLRLLMAGSGSLKGKIENIFAEADMIDRVHLPGKVDQKDLPAYYQASDLYLSASLSDGSSVSLMEALASGLPVLLSDIAGNREWVEEGKEGWFFPVNNVDTLAKAIVQAKKSSKLKGMGKSARDKVEERADWRKNRAGIAEAYAIALQAGKVMPYGSA